jgi:hypothetical protein
MSTMKKSKRNTKVQGYILSIFFVTKPLRSVQLASIFQIWEIPERISFLKLTILSEFSHGYPQTLKNVWL